MKKKLLSLCMPTNGVIEWVFPVLDSVYNQNVDNMLFEVIIADNGNNKEFKTKIKEYMSTHNNIVYVETKALPFINEIEAYKIASGELIKFVNHRTRLAPGVLNKFIELIKKYNKEKPIFYFTNGNLKKTKDLHIYNSFDEFVMNLSYWSSWSTGMTIWKSDFEKLPKDVSEFNELFPHTDVLFSVQDRGKYIIDNSVIFNELPVNSIPKAKYDLFYAFGVEYPNIILNLVMTKSISLQTFLVVRKDLLNFIATLYLNFVIRKQSCSYDLSSAKKSIKVFYTKHKLNRAVLKVFINKLIKKVSFK